MGSGLRCTMVPGLLCIYVHVPCGSVEPYRIFIIRARGLKFSMHNLEMVSFRLVVNRFLLSLIVFKWQPCVLGQVRLLDRKGKLIHPGLLLGFSV